MSDANALAEKLAILAADEPVDATGARIISEGGSPDPMTAILREVDNTVLERSLIIDCGNATVNIVAAGRRMRGITSASLPDDMDIVGQVLSREEPEGVQAAFVFLQGLCGTADKMTVRSTPPEQFGKGGERGISANGLSELWGVAMDTAPKPPIDSFLSMNAEAFNSVLHVRNGEVVSTAGDVKALKKIWSTQVDAFREAHKKTTRGDVNAQLVCLDSAFEDGSSAAMALYENDIALVAYQAESFGDIQSAWQRIFA